MKTERIAGACRVYRGDETVGRANYEIELLRETENRQGTAADGRGDSYERYSVALTNHMLDLDSLRGQTLTMHLQDRRQLRILVTRSGFIATGRLR